MTTAYEKIDTWIDTHFDEEVRYLQALVQVPTDTPPGNNAPHAERTAELLKSIEGKHSIVVVEHDMEFVGSIARKVTVLHEGSVLAEGSMQAVQENEKVIEVYLGR